jgi:hypothetical protein
MRRQAQERAGLVSAAALVVAALLCSGLETVRSPARA